MIEKVYSFIQKQNMIECGDAVVCGLSGGADSVSLLTALYELRERLGITIEALHINHCLRGNESDGDEQFCRELCERIGVPFTAVSCDVASYAENNSLSTEEAARKLRYDIFREKSEGQKIATAHNANDNLETVLLNLTRGSAIKGLTGIPPVRGNIIRPLLTVSRSEIECFLMEKRQDFVTDSTNLSDDYTRNKIRHKIIPLLEEINGSVIETTVKATDAVRTENAFIEEAAASAISECREGNVLRSLCRYHEVIRRRCIARLLTDNSLPYSYDRLEAADNILHEGGKINVSGEYFLISDGRDLELKKIPRKSEDQHISAELNIGENIIFPDRILLCELVLCDNLKKIETVHKKLTSCAIDYDKIIGRAVVRDRRFGDKIRLCGRNFTSSVKKLINGKVPADLRSSLHFIEDEQGTIFAERIGIAERVAPDCNTKRILKITISSI